MFCYWGLERHEEERVNGDGINLLSMFFWGGFWGFCTVCEVNLPTTFLKPLWAPYGNSLPVNMGPTAVSEKGKPQNKKNYSTVKA